MERAKLPKHLQDKLAELNRAIFVREVDKVGALYGVISREAPDYVLRAPVQFDLARLLENESGMEELALHAFEGILEKHKDFPGRPAALKGAGFLCHKLGKFEKALEYLEAFLKTRPDRPDADETEELLSRLPPEFQSRREGGGADQRIGGGLGPDKVPSSWSLPESNTPITFEWKVKRGPSSGMVARPKDLQAPPQRASQGPEPDSIQIDFADIHQSIDEDAPAPPPMRQSRSFKPPPTIQVQHSPPGYGPPSAHGYPPPHLGYVPPAPGYYPAFPPHGHPGAPPPSGIYAPPPAGPPSGMYLPPQAPPPQGMYPPQSGVATPGLHGGPMAPPPQGYPQAPPPGYIAGPPIAYGPPPGYGYGAPPPMTPAPMTPGPMEALTIDAPPPTHRDAHPPEGAGRPVAPPPTREPAPRNSVRKTFGKKREELPALHDDPSGVQDEPPTVPDSMPATSPVAPAKPKLAVDSPSAPQGPRPGETAEQRYERLRDAEFALLLPVGKRIHLEAVAELVARYESIVDADAKKEVMRRKGILYDRLVLGDMLRLQPLVEDCRQSLMFVTVPRHVKPYERYEILGAELREQGLKLTTDGAIRRLRWDDIKLINCGQVGQETVITLIGCNPVKEYLFASRSFNYSTLSPSGQTDFRAGVTECLEMLAQYAPTAIRSHTVENLLNRKTVAPQPFPSEGEFRFYTLWMLYSHFGEPVNAIELVEMSQVSSNW